MMRIVLILMVTLLSVFGPRPGITASTSDIHTEANDILRGACKDIAMMPCTIKTKHGSYVIPQGGIPVSADSSQAIFIDIGGPGVAPGSLERFDHSVLPDSLIKDRLVVIVGLDWGVPDATKQCLDSLLDHIDFTKEGSVKNGSTRQATLDCELQKHVANYALHGASLVKTIISQWSIDSYTVVGASFAASRWPAVLGEIRTEDKPETLTFVSPLTPDMSLVRLAKWQADTVRRVWREACHQLSVTDLIDKCNSAVARLIEDGQIGALMMVAWSPMAAKELVGYIESKEDELANTLQTFTDRYFFLNSVGYPKDELLDYFVGVCSSLRTNEIALNTNRGTGLEQKVFETIVRYHSICKNLNQGYGSEHHGVPVCYVEFTNERVTPPSSWSVHGVSGNSRNVIIPPANHYYHGDLSALHELSDEHFCTLKSGNTEAKLNELSDGIVQSAKSAIGADSLYLPVPFDDFNGMYDIANVMLSKNNDTPHSTGAKSEKEVDSDIMGYCVVGWLVPDNGEKGLSQLFAIGLNGNPAPSCDRSEGLLKTTTIVGDMTIQESVTCKSDSLCHESIRNQLSYLSNGKTSIRLN